jgi:hypothetical protein
MALVTLILGEQQASAVEIYVTDPVFDDDPDRVRVTLDGKALTFEASESEQVASGLTDVLNGIDDTAEDPKADAEERKYARQARDALTALVRRVRKVGTKRTNQKQVQRRSNRSDTWITTAADGARIEEGRCHVCGDLCDTHSDSNNPLRFCADCGGVTGGCCASRDWNGDLCKPCAQKRERTGGGKQRHSHPSRLSSLVADINRLVRK